MQRRDKFLFACSSNPVVFRSQGKTPVQRDRIDLKNENSVEKIESLRFAF